VTTIQEIRARARARGPHRLAERSDAHWLDDEGCYVVDVARIPAINSLALAEIVTDPRICSRDEYQILDAIRRWTARVAAANYAARLRQVESENEPEQEMTRDRASVKIGDSFRFTDRAIYSMPGARDGRWTRVECSCGLCASGRFVSSDEADICYGGQRHFARAGIERVECVREHARCESGALLDDQWNQLGVDVRNGLARRPLP
jgi:hypothetical protein